jgi:hypothetical protein
MGVIRKSAMDERQGVNAEERETRWEEKHEILLMREAQVGDAESAPKK